jgi:alkanesulfonate monooxygenase SsuD/methylene tetrahydromethanopterin reductase-like flavin-dependent oxidoreductase (luciferase family)
MTAAVAFGLGVPNGGDFADPRRLVQLARDAEAAGWDGLFLWDHVIRRRPWAPMVDPWVALSAIAVATERMLLGPMVTPLARRRTSVVARQTVTLDLLAGGRLRLGVGLGAPDDEFTRFGEDADPRRRARVLDESLELLEALWSGEPVSFRGDHVVADDVQFLPRPVHGTIPIWVAGGWPGGAPFRRAARHDGVWPVPAERGTELTVGQFTDCVRAVHDHREELGRAELPFDACFTGASPSSPDIETADRLGRLAEAGMTWWIETLDDPEIAFETHRERVLAGPPG